MRRIAIILAVLTLTAANGLPARAGHRVEGRYVAPATNGQFVQRNLPNPLGALETDAGYGGYQFQFLSHAPRWVKITDDVSGTADLAYTICQPNCDGNRTEGCTPSDGKVILPLNFRVTGETLLVYVHAFDPAFRACSNVASTGTITVKTK